MGGVFAFITSLFSLSASGIMAFKEQSSMDRKNKEFLDSKYNFSAQLRYERNSIGYDLDKVIEAIKDDYPNISDCNAYEVAFAAIAKRKMEEETHYKYEQRGITKYFELEKYATDKFKV